MSMNNAMTSSSDLSFADPAGDKERIEALGRSVLLASSVGGIHGRTVPFEAAVEALAGLISRHRDPATEVLRFPPVMSRRELERSGYLSSFPHLLGCVCGLHGEEAEIHKAVGRSKDGHLRATDLVLTPAACYPLYPLAASRGAVPDAGLRFDVESYCFRSEASFEIDRLRAFRMRENVYMGAPEAVIDFRARWLDRAKDLADRLGLPYRIAPASDPFFGRAARIIAASQVEQLLKFELLVPLRSAEYPTACMSFNYHRDHFASIWDRRARWSTPAALPSAWTGSLSRCLRSTAPTSSTGHRACAARLSYDPEDQSRHRRAVEHGPIRQPSFVAALGKGLAKFCDFSIDDFTGGGMLGVGVLFQGVAARARRRANLARSSRFLSYGAGSSARHPLV
jgi:hypothetical protein